MCNAPSTREIDTDLLRRIARGERLSELGREVTTMTQTDWHELRDTLQAIVSAFAPMLEPENSLFPAPISLEKSHSLLDYAGDEGLLREMVLVCRTRLAQPSIVIDELLLNFLAVMGKCGTILEDAYH